MSRVYTWRHVGYTAEAL